MTRVVGVDIGGTKIAVALEDGPAVFAPTPGTPEEIIASVVALIRRATGALRPTALGVGAAGTFDAGGRVIASTDILPGWTGTPLADRLREELGIPVAVLNDVQAAALGEATASPDLAAGRILVAAVGTGLGGAIVIEGETGAGAHGIAGSVGHIPLAGLVRKCSCGAMGHAEPYASGPGIERTYADAGGAPARVPEIARRAQAGDDRAQAAIESGADALGRALAVASTVIDPDLVIVGGGVAQLGERLLVPTRRAFREAVGRLPLDIEIRGAALGTRAAIVGAQEAARRIAA